MIIKIRIFKRKESLFPFWYFLENYEQRTGFVRLSNTRTWYRPQSSADCGECTKPPLWAISSLKKEALKNFTLYLSLFVSSGLLSTVDRIRNNPPEPPLTSVWCVRPHCVTDKV